MEEEKEGISFVDICRTIFSQKWLALIIAVAITIAGTLAIYFGYNKIKEEYVVDFTLVLPGEDAALANYHYPDGQLFNYRELITSATLNAIVEDGEGEYDDIKVDTMVKSNGISVSEYLQVTTAGENSFVERKYTIRVAAKFFKNETVARDFLTDVANYPCKYLKELNIDYSGALNLYNAADSYLKQIEYLNTQIDFITQKYTGLIEMSNGDFVVSDGKTLKYCLDSVTAYAASYEFANLSQELKENHYLMSEDTLRNYQLELKQVEEEYADAKAVLEEMQKGQSDVQSNTEVVKAQAEKVVALQRRKSDLESFTENGKVDTEGVFAERLDGVYKKAAAYTETLQNVSVTVYTSYSKAFFANSNIVTTEGHIGMIISAAGSLITGLVVAAIVAYIVGWSKLKKEKMQAEKPAEENEGTSGQQE